MKKVCFWFDRPNNKVNLWNNMESGFLQDDLLSKMYFDYEIKYRNRDSIKKSDLNLYLIELPFQDLKKFYGLLKSKAANWLRNNPLVNIVVYLPQEAAFLNNDWDHFLFFHNEFPELPNKKYFIFGNINVKKNYENTDYKSFDKVFGFDYFEYWTYFNINPIPKNLINKEKNFLSLNRHLTGKRLALLSLLHKENLFDAGYVSNLKILSPDPAYIEDAKNLVQTQDKNYINKILEGPPNILDTYDCYEPTEHDKVNLNPFYNKSFFSLISETVTFDLFITEKTYKAIIHQHPFIVWSAPYTLEYLKNKGYETYSSIFDESYDKEIDESKRLYMIIEEIKKIINWSSKEKKQKFKSVQRIAEYNKNLLEERAEHNYKKQWYDIIEEIINDQKN